MKHSIVTKTGDDGKTFLLAGVRIPKNHIRVKSYGESDELNSILGIVNSNSRNNDIKNILTRIQSQIFELGAILATPSKEITLEQNDQNTVLISKFIAFLEKHIDELEPKLPELKNFILPGGTLGASFLHLARTVCRRVERTIIDLHEVEPINAKLIIYFNRLSDLLFILARYDNHSSNVEETVWHSEK